MHNPKTGREPKYIKQVPITEDTLAYRVPQKQSLFDREITHSKYRLGYYKTLRLHTSVDSFVFNYRKDKEYINTAFSV